MLRKHLFRQQELMASAVLYAKDEERQALTTDEATQNWPEVWVKP